MPKIVPKGWNKTERLLYTGHDVQVTGHWDWMGQAEVVFLEGPLMGERRWFKPAQIHPPPYRPGVYHTCPKCKTEFQDGKDDRGDLPTVQAPAREDREGMVRDLSGSSGVGPEEEGIPDDRRPDSDAVLRAVQREHTSYPVAPSGRARPLQEAGMDDRGNGQAGVVTHAQMHMIMQVIDTKLQNINVRIDAFEELILNIRKAKANG